MGSVYSVGRGSPRRMGDVPPGFVEAASLPAWAFAITAPALFYAHPVTLVEFPDPADAPATGGRAPRGGGRVQSRHLLPLAVRTVPRQASGEVLWFPSAADAKDELSRAAVAYGRRGVGL